MHWRTYQRERVRYEQEVFKRLLLNKPPVPSFEEFNFVSWTAFFYLSRFYDADNLAALCKWPIDALVKAHVMPGDKHDQAWPREWPIQTKCKKTEAHLEMILEFKKL